MYETREGEQQEDRAQPEDKLQIEQDQNLVVGEAGRGTDTHIEEPAVQQQCSTDQSDHTGNAAHDDRDQLLETMTDAQPVEYLDRGEQAEQIPEEDHQNAQIEQDQTPDQLLAPQQLARARPPDIGLAVVADDAAQGENRQRDAEDERVEEVRHYEGSYCLSTNGSALAGGAVG